MIKNATRQSFDEVNQALIQTLQSFSVGTGLYCEAALSAKAFEDIFSSYSIASNPNNAGENKETVKMFASVVGQLVKPSRNQMTNANRVD